MVLGGFRSFHVLVTTGAKCLSYNSNTVRIPFLFSGYRTRKIKKSLFLTSVKKMGKINASLPGSSF